MCRRTSFLVPLQKDRLLSSVTASFLLRKVPYTMKRDTRRSTVTDMWLFYSRTVNAFVSRELIDLLFAPWPQQSTKNSHPLFSNELYDGTCNSQTPQILSDLCPWLSSLHVLLPERHLGQAAQNHPFLVWNARPETGTSGWVPENVLSHSCGFKSQIIRNKPERQVCQKCLRYLQDKYFLWRGHISQVSAPGILHGKERF